MKLKCIIVDDEPIARKGMLQMLANHRDIEVIACCANTIELTATLEVEKVDIVFLDIEMPYQSGLDFIKQYPNRNFQVIFTTAFSQFAVEGFDVNAIDYLVKPIQQNRFDQAIEKCKVKIAQATIKIDEPTCVMIKVDKTIQKIAVEDIKYIEAMRNYVLFYTTQKRFIHYSSFKNIDAKMSEYGFLKVQKSYIVNPHHITKVDNHSLYIKDTKIPVSRDNKHVILNQVKSLMGLVTV
jgi:DNA-binding LytR/AlgR family response regulator